MITRRFFYRVLASLAFVLVIVYLLQMVLFMHLKVESNTHAPQCISGDRLLVNRLSYGFQLPFVSSHSSVPTIATRQAKPNDWVCFHNPADTIQYINKRAPFIGKIIATAGDTIWIDTLQQDIALTAFGSLLPIPVPKAGKRIRITPWTIHLLAYTLRQHEGIPIDIINDTTLCYKGARVHSIVMQQDYYWVAAGRYHEAADSRSFGFVPQSHLIGRILGISYSLNPDLPWYKAWRKKRSAIYWSNK